MIKKLRKNCIKHGQGNSFATFFWMFAQILNVQKVRWAVAVFLI